MFTAVGGGQRQGGPTQIQRRNWRCVLQFQFQFENRYFFRFSANSGIQMHAGFDFSCSPKHNFLCCVNSANSNSPRMYLAAPAWEMKFKCTRNRISSDPQNTTSCVVSIRQFQFNSHCILVKAAAGETQRRLYPILFTSQNQLDHCIPYHTILCFLCYTILYYTMPCHAIP